MADFPLDEPDYHSKRIRDFSAFEEALTGVTPARRQALDDLLAGKTIVQIQQLMADGRLTSEALVVYYADRIRRYDVDNFNAVMELNPDARTVARRLDAERADGRVRGPLHGVPVLIKDNIASGERMHTTAGAYALRDWRAPRDAFLVQRLRAAGAVILGKANLSEWANYMDDAMPNGFSTLGGQTRNPCGPFDPLGSSSGSAVAVAAGFVTAAVGTETSGSISSPARANGVVGVKTSRGLVSRDGIMPLVTWMDVPGPLVRCVSDAAVMLTAMAGVDANDPATEDATSLAGADFTRFLDMARGKGLRMGVIVFSEAWRRRQLEDAQADDPDQFVQQREKIDRWLREREADMTRRAEQLAGLGLKIVEIDAALLPAGADLHPILTYGFREGMDRFLAGLGDEAPVASLAEVAAINREAPANRAPYGQRYLEGAVNTRMTAQEYATLSREAEQATREGLRRLLAEFQVDLLAGGDEIIRLYALAGFPAVTLPTGYDEATGEPLAVTLTGDYLAEPDLIAAAYALEQTLPAWRQPDLEDVMRSFAGLHRATPEIV
jgi:amidase